MRVTTRTRAAGMVLLSFSLLTVSACVTRAARPPRQRGFFAAMLEKGESERRHAAGSSVQAVRSTTRLWRWPLDRVHVTSSFGKRAGTFHEGIDLKAPVGTPVHAVEGGRVLFAGTQIGGYGRVVVLKHPGSGLLTVYAHLQRPLVKEGQWVSRGQEIALSGESGHASGPHLHFEIRKGVAALDPARVMTTQQAKRD